MSALSSPDVALRQACGETRTKLQGSHFVVAKYLKALQQGVFDPSSESFDIAWQAAMAPEVGTEELRLLVLDHCRRHGIAGVSDHVMPDLIRLAGRLLAHSARNGLFCVRVLHLHGWEEWLSGSISVSLATAGIFAVPQLPPLQPLLLTCKSLPGGAGLKRSLWMHIATYLAPVQQQWWHRVRHALLLPCGVLEPVLTICAGWKLLKPWRADLRECYSSRMLGKLARNDFPIDRDWEEAHHRSQNIPAMLASLAGMPRDEAASFGEVCIEVAVLAVGICLRLLEQMPVLLVGDFDDRSDVTISLLVSRILRLSHEVTTTQEAMRQEICAKTSHLVLARCDRSALRRKEELNFVESRVLEGCQGVRPVLTSLHYSEVSTLDLQLRLPPSLRKAVVFC